MAISVTTFQVLRRTYWWFRCLTCWPSAAGALPHQRGRGFSRKSMVPRPRTGKPIVGARPLQGPVRAARGHRIHLESGSPEPGAPRARRDHSGLSPRGRPSRTLPWAGPRLRPRLRQSSATPGTSRGRQLCSPALPGGHAQDDPAMRGEPKRRDRRRRTIWIGRGGAAPTLHRFGSRAP